MARPKGSRDRKGGKSAGGAVDSSASVSIRTFTDPVRKKLAEFDLDHLDMLNAELLVSAYLAATGQAPVSEDELDAMTKFRMLVNTAIKISDARRERMEVAELRELVAELRELKEFIEKNGSSSGFQERGQ